MPYWALEELEVGLLFAGSLSSPGFLYIGRSIAVFQTLGHFPVAIDAFLNELSERN